MHLKLIKILLRVNIKKEIQKELCYYSQKFINISSYDTDLTVQKESLICLGWFKNPLAWNQI